jgi:hypothetical protein
MTKVYDGKLSSPSLSAMRIATAQMLGLNIKYPQRSTLNEHMKFLTDKLPAPTDRTQVRYLAIGNRGHDVVVEDDGFADMDPRAKTANMSGMFNMIPLVLRPKDNDLSDEERKNYAFRIEVTYNNRQYWAYFLKRIKMVGVETTDTLIVRVNGVEKPDDFVYTDNDLYPQPVKLPDFDYDNDNNVGIPDGRYVQSTATIVIPFDEFDVAELQNVYNIMRGSAQRSVISEMALCTGKDYPHTGESATGSPFSYDEAIGVQTVYNISLYKNVAQENQGFNVSVTVGQPAPFYIGL